MKENLWNHILSVREKSPLIHNITNYVVMNNSANALLAVGASPIMAHASQEITQMLDICNALVINIGTLDEHWADAMLAAAARANAIKKPWVLDPVGSGATNYRNQVLQQLIALRPTVIRGNASEIMALGASTAIQSKGADSTAESTEAVQQAMLLNERTGAVVCVSGETDIIVNGREHVELRNGHAMMTKVTGLGCSSTAVIAAFIATGTNTLEAVTAAMALFSIAGEMAAENSAGPGSLQVAILDKLYNMTRDEFDGRLKIKLR